MTFCPGRKETISWDEFEVLLQEYGMLSEGLAKEIQDLFARAYVETKADKARIKGELCPMIFEQDVKMNSRAARELARHPQTARAASKSVGARGSSGSCS